MSFTAEPMPQTDTTDDNDGAVMSDQPKPKATPDFVLVQVETKRKVKKRRGKLRKLVSIIVRVVGYPFIPVSRWLVLISCQR